MRIREIISELTRPASSAEAGQRLRQAGYASIGSGLFGKVWAKPNDPFVLKLFTANDTAYLSFVRLAQAMPNEHFPVFRGRPMQVSDAYYGVRIERLQKAPASLLPLVQRLKFYIGALSLLDVYRNSTGKDRFRIQEPLKELRWLRFNQPSLAQALDAIYEYVVKPSPDHVMADLSLWNIGLRGTTIVIMDPVGSGAVTDDPEVRMESGPTANELENIELDKALRRKPDMRKKHFVAMPGQAVGEHR